MAVRVADEAARGACLAVHASVALAAGAGVPREVCLKYDSISKLFSLLPLQRAMTSSSQQLPGPTEGFSDADASSVCLNDIVQLCSLGTAGEVRDRSARTASQGGAKGQRARVALETLDILRAGRYVEPLEGSEVELEAALCQALAASTFHPEASWRPPAEARDGEQHFKTEIEVRCCTVLAAAEELAASGNTPGVLNFASARNPGGGFTTGAEAQEESLARSSAIYPCLSKHFQAFFVPHRNARSGVYTHSFIHSPRVPVIRDDKGQLLASPYLVNFVTAAAPNRGALQQFESPEKAAREAAAALKERICRVLHAFAAGGSIDLVLGAWGCGVFQNDPTVVAQLFGEAIHRDFKGRFRRVLFAVLDPSMAVVFGAELGVDPGVVTKGDGTRSANGQGGLDARAGKGGLDGKGKRDKQDRKGKRWQKHDAGDD